MTKLDQKKGGSPGYKQQSPVDPIAYGQATDRQRLFLRQKLIGSDLATADAGLSYDQIVSLLESPDCYAEIQYVSDARSIELLVKREELLVDKAHSILNSTLSSEEKLDNFRTVMHKSFAYNNVAVAGMPTPEPLLSSATTFFKLLDSLTNT